ncbi:MAG: LuxR C-terminal-related transcriptional regulator [Kineosporiaceae bacterium]
MTGPLVATKLFVPRLRSTLVDRPRLTARLEDGAAARLTLVSAPAGFGKTTALAAWLARDRAAERTTGHAAAHDPARRGVAWVSLEPDDAQPATFWTYVVAALHGAVPGVGAGVLPLLRSGRVPPIRTVLTAILNDLAAQPVEVDLVLDDYHLVDGPELAADLTFLLDHLPPTLHVALSTRADPDLPLARWRARGELVEIRSRDLRFTVAETAAYLTDVNGLSVSPADVSVLEARTEGWAAALQLAALSMQDRGDLDDFIASFAGTDRFVVDYLVDEVLAGLPEAVRDFLLRTCVLDRLGAQVCDAVLETTGSRAMLHRIERANLFLIPLDDQRHWYRYHHLFADVLRAHLRDEQGELVPGLHRRAADWFDAAGEPVLAVRHALAAGDVERAADLSEAAIPRLQRDRQEATIRSWIGDLPDEVVRRRPVLAIGFVGALMSMNEFETVAGRLDDVEQLLPAIRSRLGSGSAGDIGEAGHDDELVMLDDAELARVPAAVELYRAALALVHGDLATTITRAQQAITTSVPGDDVIPSAAAGLAGLAHWTIGDLDAAHASYTACADGLRRAGHLPDVLGCSITLADLRIAQGRWREAQATYEAAVRLAEQPQAGPRADEAPRGLADMHLGLAQLAVERGDLAAARDQMAIARSLGEALGLPQFPYRWRAVAASLAQADGDLPAARDLLIEAQQVYVGDFSPEVRPLPAVLARVQLALGDVEAAAVWAAERAGADDETPSYLREFELLTLAEVRLVQARRDGDRSASRRVETLLDLLLAAAQEGGRGGAVLDAMVLHAVASQARGDLDGALVRLQSALTLAEPEHQVRAFARHGVPMGELLDHVIAQRGSWSFAREVRAACRGGDAPSGVVDSSAATGSVAAARDGGLVVPLSARELDVLRLLASDLDGPDIARHLVVSLNTVRTHTKNIYAKLGVTNRRAAVRRAGEVGLLGRR